MDAVCSYGCFPIILFAFLVFRFLFRRPTRNLPPSPWALPIIGHLHHLRGKPLHEALAVLSRRYGPILHLRLGVRSAVAVSSPTAVQECFTKNDVIFANRPRTVAGDTLTYNYTAVAWAPYGQLWRVLRRVALVEVFSPICLQKASPIRDEETTNLARRLFRASSRGEQKVDLQLMFSFLSFDVILKIVAGKRFCEGDSQDMEAARQLLKDLREMFVVSMPMTSLHDFLPILRWFGYSGMEKKLGKLQRKRDEFLQNLIDEARQKANSDPSLKSEGKVGRKKNTFMESLLSLHESDPEFYTEDVVKSMVLTMFIAGTGTSVTSMERAMSLLLSHPEALQKVREEIDGRIGCARLLRDSDLAGLPYLRCVVYETLRLHPPAQLLLPHFSSGECTLGGYEVPRETMVLVNAWAVQRDATAWEEPEEFRPERFAGVEGEREGCRFIPFGMGRRACPGAAMALRIIALGVGVIVQGFEWETAASSAEALCSPRREFVPLLAEL